MWLYQCLCAFSAILMMFAHGINEHWCSVYLPQLLKGHPFKINSLEEFWIVNSMGIAGIISCITILLVDKIGRKKLLIATAIFSGIASILLIVYFQVDTLYISRFLYGLSNSAVGAIIPMYIGEISHPKIRGSIGMGIFLAKILSALFVNLAGTYITVQKTAIIGLTCILIFIILFLKMPESPYFLFMTENGTKARKSIQKLSGGVELEADIRRIQTTVQQQTGNKVLDLFKIRQNRRGFLILIVSINCKLLTGVLIFDNFGQVVFGELLVVWSPTVTSLVFYLVQFVAIILSLYLVEKLGRRILLLVAVSVAGVCSCLVGLVFFFKSELPNEMQYFCVVLIVIYAVAASFLLALPAVSLSELLTINVKCFAFVLVGLYNSFVVIGLSAFFQLTYENFGMYVPFFVFGVLSGLQFVFGYLYILETKGKTLEEIQEELNQI